MKKLHFSYEMQIEYSVEVARCNFTIKCIPKDTQRQRVHDYKIHIFPAVGYNEGVDGLRNLQIYGVNEEPHTIFNFKIEGNVTTGFEAYDEFEEDDIAMIFGHPHGFNIAGDKIREFYMKNKPSEDDSEYAQAVHLMHKLHDNFTYKICTTNVDTPAEEAFSQGCGVCQDYAHILISLLHLAGISARYVTGLIVGEGASHAWVEMLWQGKWYGLDPTNNKVVDDDYIKIGIGRDAKDCLINRGIMHGGGLHTQIIKVNVTEEGIE